MAAGIASQCAGNLIAIGVLPFRLGQTGAPLWYLPVYAVIAGLVLTVAENPSFAEGLFFRRDVRSYIRVRIAMVTVLGAAPFAAGHSYTAVTMAGSLG